MHTRVYHVKVNELCLSVSKTNRLNRLKNKMKSSLIFSAFFRRNGYNEQVNNSFVVLHFFVIIIR